MKTVLMIAPYFTPRRRVGALRPFKFAVNLQHFGFKPVVLTIHSTGDVCSEREKELLKGVEVISLKSFMDRTNPKSTNTQSAEKKKQRPSGFSEKILGWIDRHTPVDTWIIFLWFRFRYILRKSREVNPDLIWATGDPWSSLWLGEKLSRVLKKPLLSDFRDPWTLSNVNLRKRSTFASRIDKRVEKRIIEHSEKVLFTSSYTCRTYSEHYDLPQQRCGVIYNSIDSDLLNEKWEQPWGTSLDPKYLNLLFFGRFRRLSPISPALFWLSALESSFPDLAPQVRIHSFGTPDIDPAEMERMRNYDQTFVFHEPVLTEMKRSVLQQADLLLLSTHPEREGVIPAKFWDYLDSGKPVLSLLRHPEVGAILRNHQSGYQPDWSENGYMKAAEWTSMVLKNPKQSEGFATQQLNGTAQQMYSSLNTTQKLATTFQQVLGEGVQGDQK